MKAVGWRVGVAVEANEHSPNGHVSVLGLAWLGTALQWRLGDSWHGLVHQHLFVLHFLTCDTDEMSAFLTQHYRGTQTLRPSG